MPSPFPTRPPLRRVIQAVSVILLSTVLWSCSEQQQDEAGAGDPSNGPDCGMNAEKQRERLGVPGLSAAVVKDGRIVCTVVAGMADIEGERPVTPETLFAWASVSKTVTATAVMQLVDDGRIALEDDVNAHLLFPVRNPHCPDRPITVAQLLSHTSSIREEEYEGVYADHYVQGDSPVVLGDFLKDYLTPDGAHYSPRNFGKRCPGQRYAYSNIASGLLGHLVETVAGMPFERFTEERLFVPLQMTETAWRLAHLSPDHIAMPYEGSASASFERAGHIGFPTYPDGLLRTSPAQLARFLMMFIQRGELDGVRLLSPASAEAMRREHFPKVTEGQGLIWYYDTIGGRKGTLGHSGSDPGTSSIMAFDPKDGAGALLVANGSWNWDRADGVMKKLFKAAHNS